ncbi:hypothetical protein [Mesorhizobium sp.]|uniref:hypothetical protein n=1 Tax=Mesorhizobium sp. TaxID=1871066 RepID=UPI000FE71420|nr:hypothetical protein [Mesorhizobium sp.]RWC64273.1 MAG: hypothetical protein EOS56_00910 [Mesorhizobium sp.]RWC67140.1 MAG: hypothetical protein EOS29_01740 [Mesorhizobium sp.]
MSEGEVRDRLHSPFFDSSSDMNGRSTFFYVVVFFGAAAACLFILYVTLWLLPQIRYFAPPTTIVIGCFKPFNWKISFKSVVASLVFLLIGYLLVFISRDDILMSVLMILSSSYMYLGYIKDMKNK